MNRQTRRQFIKTASAAIPALGIGNQLFAATGAGKKPNLVFVFADQMRAHAMGCMGNDQVITPNLDKMAADGLLVRNALSIQPVCTPYRAHLLTGRYGHSTGVIHNDIRLPDRETLLPEQMKKAGYATGYIGKWHLTETRLNPIDAKSSRGWDFWAVRNCSHKHSDPVYWLNDSKQPTRVPGWEPDVQTDLAVEFIKKKKNDPFCLFLSFGPPHQPYKAPQKYLNMYERQTLKPRPNVPYEIYPVKGKGDTVKPSMAEVLHEYYAMVTSVDECMGRINAALEEAGVADDTIVVFTSDHGDMLGSQGHIRKQRPWEESINIPFIVRYPSKIKQGQVKDWIVSSVDVMPTLLGMCNVPIPPQVEGMDYSDTFLGKSDKERDAAFLFNVHGGGGPGTDWRGIRTKEWVYAYHYSGDWVMYDLKNDPYELDNLIDNPAYAAQKKKLRDQLEAMRAELGETIPLKGIQPDPVKLPKGKQE
ncbi:Arylsulfatase [Pontiella desulfatans]|uniref:Arylsulfatase n=1 Tax=Pontiella desulfatans TaxID=2750659 RepID=A0A6C2U143_PONDE|nr:sulfatase [Pontiella desulfatans]SPS73841.1 sulfatase S1_27 [Kiritimatiellales bacterium]VGO13593.1 Arylsulfatase [Pontiella desulfatans]